MSRFGVLGEGNSEPQIQELSTAVGTVTFDDWTRGRTVASFGTNAGAAELPFQSWRHFKEAFAPELVARAVSKSKIPVCSCLDPFGGSGTTALASQFLGVHPVTIEVNPFLADLIEVKLSEYCTDELVSELGELMRRADASSVDESELLSHLPKSFVEPGVKGRWIFDRPVALRIAGLLSATDDIVDERHQRLFRVLLGGILIDVSNVVINGKGRRYRQGWKRRLCVPNDVDVAFLFNVQRAISDVHRYARRQCLSYDLFRGDCRTALSEVPPCELAVFSPPYPNSFDYTDVYNVELWMLGYLMDACSNQALRKSTLSSHVQVGRRFPQPPTDSPKLQSSLDQLYRCRMSLWDRRIPEMVGGYFSDLMNVLLGLHARIVPNGAIWMVVGDSRYADVRIETAEIVAELAKHVGWDVEHIESCRSMRASPQQGGQLVLREKLVVLRRV